MPANKANNKKTGATPAAAAEQVAESAAGAAAAGVAAAGATEAGATEAGAAQAGAGEAGAGEAGAADDEFIPANRAERRAQGKGKAANQPTGRGGAKVGGGHGPAQAQRMWTNRRSGG